MPVFVVRAIGQLQSGGGDISSPRPGKISHETGVQRGAESEHKGGDREQKKIYYTSDVTNAAYSTEL